MRIIEAIKYRIWRFFNTLRCKGYRQQYKNSDVSIISMNCTGGILSHNLGQQFLSPTVNMYMKAEDFIKFCENLDHYLAIEKMQECFDPSIIEGRKYPIAILDDIYLYLVHYKSVEQAQKKWDERKKRINPNKIVVINTDREGMTPELMDRFEKLSYKKVMFTHIHHPHRGSHFFYIKGYEQNSCVGIVTDPIGWLGLRPIDQFDWIKFLNEV